jgi:hypothetical protein
VIALYPIENFMGFLLEDEGDMFNVKYAVLAFG